MKTFYVTRQRQKNERTMDAIIQELHSLTIHVIVSQIDPTGKNNHKDLHDYVEYNKDDVSEYLTQSPFWLYFMDCRDRNCGDYRDIHEKVKYDYALALNSMVEDIIFTIPLSSSEINKHIYSIRDIMWREAQKEKLISLYKKVPIDVINEMLVYMDKV